MIDELKKCDPDSVVCAGFDPIFFVEVLEPYWDGYVGEVRDGKWIYNTDKNKVVLHLWDEHEFVASFFGYKKPENIPIIPTLEKIFEHVENLPKDIEGKIRESYPQRFIKAFNEWIRAFESVEKSKKRKEKKWFIDIYAICNECQTRKYIRKLEDVDKQGLMDMYYRHKNSFRFECLKCGRILEVEYKVREKKWDKKEKDEF